MRVEVIRKWDQMNSESQSLVCSDMIGVFEEWLENIPLILAVRAK